MWDVSEEDFKRIADWGLAENPFAAVDDFSPLKPELRWLNPEQQEVYANYVKARNSYIQTADFDKYYREAKKPIDRRRWEYLMHRKAWYIMPLGWQNIAQKGGKVIDLGCGDGDTVQRLIHFIEAEWEKHGVNDLEVEIVGIDLNASRVQNAQELVTCTHPRISARFEQGDAIGTPLAFDDNYFDFALCCGVFEILNNEQFQSFLTEMSRIVARGIFIEDVFERFPGGYPRDDLGRHLLANGFVAKDRHVILTEPFSDTEMQDPKKLWPMLLIQNIWAEAV